MKHDTHKKPQLTVSEATDMTVTQTAQVASPDVPNKIFYEKNEAKCGTSELNEGLLENLNMSEKNQYPKKFG